MNILDIILGIILLYSFYKGLKKGLFVTLASLVGLIAGVYGAIYFSDYAAGYLSNWFNWSEQVTNLAAFAVTFLVIVFVVSAAGKFLTKVADFAALGLINKLLGGAFGLLTAAFIVSVIFMFINAQQSLSGYVISEEKKEASFLYEPIASLAPMVLPDLIEDVEEFRNNDDHEEDENSEENNE